MLLRHELLLREILNVCERVCAQEMEKMALAETTGLDQKQINNWFINQRKRHWKPTSEDMPFAMMEAAAAAGAGGFHVVPQGAAAALYMADNRTAAFLAPDGVYRLGS
jgi:hypothetical protein